MDRKSIADFLNDFFKKRISPLCSIEKTNNISNTAHFTPILLFICLLSVSVLFCLFYSYFMYFQFLIVIHWQVLAICCCLLSVHVLLLIYSYTTMYCWFYSYIWLLSTFSSCIIQCTADSWQCVGMQQRRDVLTQNLCQLISSW